MTFGKNGSVQTIADLVPPVIELDGDYKKEISTNKTLANFSGKVIDNTEFEKIVLSINGKNLEFNDIIEDFDLDVSLKAGNNKYELIAYDGSGNKTSLTGNIYLGDTVAAGNSHSGALYNEELYTWGRNNYAQTGLGYTSSLSDSSETEPHPISPIKIATPSKFVAISFNQNFSLAIDENGDLYSWGSDKAGELGRGDDLKDSCSKDSDCRKSIKKLTI